MFKAVLAYCLNETITICMKPLYSTLLLERRRLLRYIIFCDAWKISRIRALLWHFNGYYDSPDILINFRYPKGIVKMREYYMSKLVFNVNTKVY